MTRNELEKKMLPGDLVFVKSKGFLPWAIRFFMRIYAKLKYGYNPTVIYNHMGIIGSHGNEIRVGESTAKGFPFRMLTDAYKLEDWGNRVVVYRFCDDSSELSYDKMAVINNKIKTLSFDQTPYEFWNFIWWIVFIMSGFKIYIGAKGRKARKKMYCFESAIRCFQASGIKLFDNPQKITSVDVLESGHFFRVV